MREIKFRAWDKDGHDWFYFDLKSTHINIPAVADDNTVQQYTGLKDKNGKEIYEGDIVRVLWHYDGDKKIDEHVDTIQFEYGAFGVAKAMGYELDMLSLNRLCEVISNIYENKELLT